MVPYTKGLSEGIKTVCRKHGNEVFFTGGKAIKDLLMASKDKDPITKKSGVIYSLKCDRMECNEGYIGESLRTFVEMFKEHLKLPSPVYDHFNTTSHISIVEREPQNLMRLINEAIYIMVNNASLNKNIDK